MACNPPFKRGKGCCKCCPPDSCSQVRFTFNLTKTSCSSSSSSSSGSSSSGSSSSSSSSFVPGPCGGCVYNCVDGAWVQGSTACIEGCVCDPPTGPCSPNDTTITNCIEP